MWVAGGAGGNTLAYSYNGINWTGLGTTTFTGGYCYSLCWSGSAWVGLGQTTTGVLVYNTSPIKKAKTYADLRDFIERSYSSKKVDMFSDE
jgi:hypothetical protein